MIQPQGFRGAAFGAATDGDARTFADARRRMAALIGVSEQWAYPTQVHGASVVRASAAGHLGEADAVFTTRPGLPIAVATADCVPVILEGPEVVAVIHVGWRGAEAGVVVAARAAIDQAGLAIERAALGPSIGPCCYEVGSEVVDLFPEHLARTRWGTTSIDLAGFVAVQLDDLAVWRAAECTFETAGLHSHRRSGTAGRQVAVGWIPRP